MPIRRPRFGLSRGLLLLNASLLLLLVLVTASLPAEAQNAAGPPARARGEYTMVAGRTTAGGASVIYLIDGANQELIALRWDNSRQTMTTVGYRTITTEHRIDPGR
jgi:hypothetical protein